MRKAAYQKIAPLCGPGGIWGQRLPLPDCAVAAVRSIWPEANGNYMGE
jgi:hypothetical protein